MTCNHNWTMLSKGPAMTVRRCGCCGNLHLDIGSLTLRVTPEVAESFRQTLADALTEERSTNLMDLFRQTSVKGVA